MFSIENLSASIDETPIIKNFSLQIEPGQIHVIMGPNGAGKSTLAKVLSGHPTYAVSSGSARLNGIDLLSLEPEERAQMGLFMSFQYPLEVLGCSNFDFLYTIKNAQLHSSGQEKLTREEFESLLLSHLETMQMKKEFLDRDINVGFSGGEKKKNEILQMLILDPKVVILDETDSGLDIDAMKIVAEGVNRFMSKDKCIIVITHYQRLLDYIKPDTIHVMIDGKIALSGDHSLAIELEERGYEGLVKQLSGV